MLPSTRIIFRTVSYNNKSSFLGGSVQDVVWGTDCGDVKMGRSSHPLNLHYCIFHNWLNENILRLIIITTKRPFILNNIQLLSACV